jgi:hypothetical protein
MRNQDFGIGPYLGPAGIVPATGGGNAFEQGNELVDRGSSGQ